MSNACLNRVVDGIAWKWFDANGREEIGGDARCLQLTYMLTYLWYRPFH